MDGPDKTPAELVAQYIKLRNLKKQAEEQYKQFCQENYDEPMKQLEFVLLDTLNKLGVDSIAGKTGTVYKILHTSVTTADGGEFRRHVIGSEEWELADWKPNKTVINEMVNRGDPLPPGVNRTAFYKVGILKGK